MLGEVENEESQADRYLKEAELESLKVTYRNQHGNDNVGSGKTEQQIQQLRYELSLARSQTAVRPLTSPIHGQVLTGLSPRDLGEYFSPGEEVMRIGGRDWIVRAVADSHSLAEVNPQAGQEVHFRFQSHPERVYLGSIERVSVSGSRIVPHKALTHLAGGFIPVHAETMEATEPFFEMLIRFEADDDMAYLKNGNVCEIRFGRSRQTIGSVVYRALLRFTNQVNLSHS